MFPDKFAVDRDIGSARDTAALATKAGPECVPFEADVIDEVTLAEAVEFARRIARDCGVFPVGERCFSQCGEPLPARYVGSRSADLMHMRHSIAGMWREVISPQLAESGPW